MFDLDSIDVIFAVFLTFVMRHEMCSRDVVAAMSVIYVLGRVAWVMNVMGAFDTMVKVSPSLGGDVLTETFRCGGRFASTAPRRSRASTTVRL